MSRVVPFTILGGLVIAIVTAINVGGVNGYEDTKFIPVSVLSKKQANYAADKNLIAIPAVSADILEDKVRDTEMQSSVPIIRYTSLPVEKKKSIDEDDAQSTDQGEPNSNQGNNGNDNSNQNMNDNGNGNSNQNMNNNGNGNAGGSNNGSNNGKEKEKEKEKEKGNKPAKSNSSENKDTAPKDKNTTPDKPDKDKKDK